MVSSPSCVEDGLATGVGLAVPFIKELEFIEDFLDEAACLWLVESRTHVCARGAVSATWGSVALLVNPGRTVEPDFLAAWTRAVGRY